MAIETRDIWSLIQQEKREGEAIPAYVHPMLKRSASFLSQKSLEVCTESLGSETGSDGFSDLEDHICNTAAPSPKLLQYRTAVQEERKGLAAVNYHRSVNRRSPPRSFPPPLPSISRRDGPCFNMRTRRQDGRLVVHAVPVPSQNYLHCERRDGRLLLSFVETTFPEPEQQAEEERLEEVMELGVEEVEVVDRGIVVEVKVSRQPQLPWWRAGKVRRSSLVINKFVSGLPVAGDDLPEMDPARGAAGGRRLEMLHQVRRCSESQTALFIWEPCLAA